MPIKDTTKSYSRKIMYVQCVHIDTSYWVYINNVPLKMCCITKLCTKYNKNQYLFGCKIPHSCACIDIITLLISVSKMVKMPPLFKKN